MGGLMWDIICFLGLLLAYSCAPLPILPVLIVYVICIRYG